MGDQSDVVNLLTIARRQHKSEPDVDYLHQRCMPALGCDDITRTNNVIALSEGDLPASEKICNFKLYNAGQAKEIVFVICVEHLFS
jgi:hypothetical protein